MSSQPLVDSLEISVRYRAYCETEGKYVSRFGTYKEAREKAIAHQNRNPTHVVTVVAEQQAKFVVERFN